jgi:hypothetical protein
MIDHIDIRVSDKEPPFSKCWQQRRELRRPSPSGSRIAASRPVAEGFHLEGSPRRVSSTKARARVCFPRRPMVFCAAGRVGARLVASEQQARSFRLCNAGRRKTYLMVKPYVLVSGRNQETPAGRQLQERNDRRTPFLQMGYVQWFEEVRVVGHSFPRPDVPASGPVLWEAAHPVYWL